MSGVTPPNKWIKAGSTATKAAPTSASTATADGSPPNPWLKNTGATTPTSTITDVPANRWIKGSDVGSIPKVSAVIPTNWENHYKTAIDNAASVFGVPEGVLRGVLGVETRTGDPAAVGRNADGTPSGAIGLGQFMPDTAKEYGMIVGQHDYRTNGVLSIYSTAHYLSDLYTQFKGAPDAWARAVASYNAGSNAVGQAAESGASWLNHLPNETRAYVPNVMAIAQQYGLNPQPKPGWTHMAAGGKKQTTSIDPTTGQPTTDAAVMGFRIADNLAGLLGKKFQSAVEYGFLIPTYVKIHEYQNALGQLFDLLQRTSAASLERHIAQTSSGQNFENSMRDGLHVLAHSESVDKYYAETDFAANQDAFAQHLAYSASAAVTGGLMDRTIQKWGPDVTKWPAFARSIAEMTTQAIYDPLTFLPTVLEHGTQVVQGLEKMMPTAYRAAFDGLGTVAGMAAKFSPATTDKAAAATAMRVERAEDRLKRPLTYEERAKIGSQSLTKAQLQAVQQAKMHAQVWSAVTARIIGFVRNHWETAVGLEGKIGKEWLNGYQELEMARHAGLNHNAFMAARWDDTIAGAFSSVPRNDRWRLIDFLLRRVAGPTKMSIDQVPDAFKKGYLALDSVRAEIAHLYGDDAVIKLLNANGFKLPDELTPFQADEPRGWLELKPPTGSTMDPSFETEHPYDQNYFTQPHFIEDPTDAALGPGNLLGRVTGREFKNKNELEVFDPFVTKVESRNLDAGKTDDYIRSFRARARVAAAKISADMVSKAVTDIATKYKFDKEAPYVKSFFMHPVTKIVMQGKGLKDVGALVKEVAGAAVYGDSALKSIVSWAQIGYFVNPTVHMGNISQLVAMRNPLVLLKTIANYAHIMSVDATKGINGRMLDPYLSKYARLGVIGPSRGGITEALSPREVSDYGLTGQTRAIRNFAEGNFARTIRARPLLHLIATAFDAPSRVLWPFDDAAKLAMYQHEIQGGANESQALHKTLARLIDYADPSPYARAARNLFWFMTWKTKMPIAVLRMLIENPYWVVQYARAFPSQFGVPHQSQWSTHRIGDALGGAMQGVESGGGFAGAVGGAATGYEEPTTLPPGKKIGVGPLPEAFKTFFMPTGTFTSPLLQDAYQYLGPLLGIHPSIRQKAMENLADTFGMGPLAKQAMGEPVIGQTAHKPAKDVGEWLNNWIDNFMTQAERETQYRPVNPKYFRELIDEVKGVPQKQIQKQMYGHPPGKL